MKHSLLAILFIAIGIAGCDDRSGGRGDKDPGGLDTVKLAPGATGSPATSDSTPVAIDSAALVPVVTHTALISTTMGDIEVDLYGKDAPKSVKNFVGLARKKYYDGVAFHRVIPNFVIQTGDAFSKDSTKRQLWGQGGESIYGKPFEDELDTSLPSARNGYVEGTLAMANKGRNTNTSQFFIILSTDGVRRNRLPYSYTIFGMVRKGMDIAHRIEETGLQGEKPVQPAKIRSITVTERGAVAAAAPAPSAPAPSAPLSRSTSP